MIEELEKYTLEHFAAEESFMRVIDYLDFESHRQEHQRFVARIGQEKSHAQKTGVLSMDIMYFLKDWLIKHILVADKAYAKFYEQQNAEAVEGSFLERFFKRLF